MATFEENIKNTLQKKLKARQARDVATFEENIKITLQKILKARQERDVTFYAPYNPRRIWTLLKKTSKIQYKK